MTTENMTGSSRCSPADQMGNTSGSPADLRTLSEVDVQLHGQRKDINLPGDFQNDKLAFIVDNVFSKKEGQNYFFALKNISFCGYHPRNNRYFGFITKHPAERRFACHVLVSEDSTRPVAEALGRAFRKFYAEYMDYTHPTEDIYME